MNPPIRQSTSRLANQAGAERPIRGAGLLAGLLPGLLPGLLVGLLACLPGLIGCASTSGPAIGRKSLDFRQEKLEKEVSHLGFTPEDLIFPSRPTPEMKAWARTTVPPTGDPEVLLQTLLAGLLTEQGLHIQYRAGFTATAPEVFAERFANCLSFTHLFVGLARDLGLDAYFLDVANARNFDRSQDLIVLSGHVTAGYGVSRDPLVLQYDVGPDVDYKFVQKISDRTALAMFYSNRGAEALQAGQLETALEWLRTAVSLDSELGQAWINYGVVLRRLGEEDGAEEAYRKALEVDPRAATAYQNLASLLRLQGREGEAREMDQLAEGLGSRNPYNYLSLGDMNLRHGRVEEAERLYLRALRVDRNLPDAYAALGLLAALTDRPAEARRWLEKARKRDEENPRVRHLERRLEAAKGDVAPFARLEAQPRKAS